MKIFTIHDTKADSHLQPFFAENQDVAVRLLRDPCKDAGHNFCKHAGDYHLYLIGEFHEDKGEIENWQKIHITCLDVLALQAADLMDAGASEQINSMRAALTPQGGE